MRDHDGCEEAILAAMRNDRPGKAEFLAARCDLKHGHLKTDLHERVTTDPPRPEPEAGTETAAPNEAALSEEDAWAGQ